LRHFVFVAEGLTFLRWNVSDSSTPKCTRHFGPRIKLHDDASSVAIVLRNVDPLYIRYTLYASWFVGELSSKRLKCYNTNSAELT